MLSAMTTAPGGASCCRRAATFGVLTDDRFLLGRPFADKIANNHQAGGDSDTGGKRMVAAYIESPNGLNDRQPGAHRALRLVLVRPRPAEIGQHPIAHQLSDVALEALDPRRDRIVVGGNDFAHVLRIEAGRKRCRTGEVDEHHRQMTPLGSQGLRSAGVRGGGLRRHRGSYGFGFGPEPRRKRRDRRKQFLAMTQRSDAEFAQIVRCQAGQDFGIDIVVAKRPLVLIEPQSVQPSCHIHFCLPPINRDAPVSRRAE